jgi:sugar phosphate permease
LVLFIVSVLAAAWALATLIRMSSTRRSAMFVAFVDLCFVGALIGGVVELRGIASENCSHFSTGSFYVSLGPFGYFGDNIGSAYFNINKTCSMLKASFAFGIMNIIFFFITFILALLLHRHQRDVVVREKVTRRRSHGSRRGHSSRRSHSSRRQYYV